MSLLSKNLENLNAGSGYKFSATKINDLGAAEYTLATIVMDASSNTPIAWTDLIDEFTGFKTTEGEFVLRRMSAFKRKCLKEGITHSDDISIGSIVI